MGIKNLILNLSFVKREMESQKLKAILDDRANQEQEKYARDQRIMQHQVGMPIIIISGERSPELAIIESWADKSIPCVKNYIDGERYTLFTTYIPYNAQNLLNIFRINPDERLGLINECFQTHQTGYKTTYKVDDRNYQETIEIAEELGFFDKVNEYWKKKHSY